MRLVIILSVDVAFFMQGIVFVSYIVADNQSKVYISIDISFISVPSKEVCDCAKNECPQYHANNSKSEKVRNIIGLKLQ